MEAINIIYILVAAVSGIVIGKLIFAKNNNKIVEDAKAEADKLIADGKSQSETLKKEKLLEAKEQIVQMRADLDKDVLQRTQKLSESENRIKQKEQSLNQKDANVEKQVKENEAIKENLNRQTEIVNIKRTELEKHQEEHIRRLEKVAGLSAEDAKNQLIDSLKQEAETRALVLQQEIIEDAKQKANKEARKIVIQTIQRTAAEQAIEN